MARPRWVLGWLSLLLASACGKLPPEDCAPGTDLHAGHLVVGTEGALPDLRCLEFISGDLTIGPDADGPSPMFERLVHIGGDLILVDNPSLEDLSALPSLALVSGDVVVENNAELRALEGSRLQWIGGDLSVRDNDALRTLAGLEQLREVDGSVVLVDNGELARAPLAELAQIGGDLEIRGSALKNLAPMAALTRVGGGLSIKYNGDLSTLEGLVALQGIGGNLGISSNARLEGWLPRGSSVDVGGSLRLSDNPRLTRADGLRLDSPGPLEVAVSDNAALESVSFELLPGFPSVTFLDNAALERIELELPLTAEELVVIGAPALQVVSVGPWSPTLDRLTIKSTGLTSLAGMDLGGIGCWITIADNPALERLWGGSPPFLGPVNGAVTDNPRLPACQVEAWFGSDRWVQGDPRTSCVGADPNRVSGQDPVLRLNGNDDGAMCEP